jgi:hypothetical protein
MKSDFPAISKGKKNDLEMVAEHMVMPVWGKGLHLDQVPTKKDISSSGIGEKRSP